jgi:hypothetical protein
VTYSNFLLLFGIVNFEGKKTIILSSISSFYEGPAFFASGQIFLLIWLKGFAKSWQHW